ncbi:hypothetical protein GCM10009646_05350 [Streptomyces aureus]
MDERVAAPALSVTRPRGTDVHCGELDPCLAESAGQGVTGVERLLDLGRTGFRRARDDGGVAGSGGDRVAGAAAWGAYVSSSFAGRSVGFVGPTDSMTPASCVNYAA